MSRLLKITGFFCRIQSLLYSSFVKKTQNFKECTNRTHPIVTLSSHCLSSDSNQSSCLISLSLSSLSLATGRRRLIGFLICTGHFPQKSPIDVSYLCHPTQSIMYVPLQANRFKKIILLIVQYKYLKSCSRRFYCPNLILRTRLCGTMFITQPSCLFDFRPTESVSWK